MTLSDIYNDPTRDLTDKEINFLMRNGYVFNKNTTENIYKNYSLFFRSLCKNFDKTVNALQEFDFDNVTFEKMDSNLSFNIYHLLDNNLFCIDNKNVKLIQYNPLFLISSLNNNYFKTISAILKNNEKKVFVVPSFDVENKILFDVLVSNKFVLNSKNVSLVKNSFIFLLVSFRNDFNATMRALKHSDLDFVDMDINYTKKLMEILFDEYGLKMNKLPVSIQNTIIKYLDEYDNRLIDREHVVKYVEEGNIPCTYFNSNTLYANNELLSLCTNNYEELAFLYTRMWSYSYCRFDKSDENKVLLFLKDKYKKCECVEDVLKSMHDKNLTRDKMSLMEMFAIQLYGAKELSKISSNAFVDVFSLDPYFQKIGAFDKKTVKVCINSKNLSVLDMVNTLHHEIEHVIQRQNIDKMKINIDNDVDVYYKDVILREFFFGEKYYEENYKSICLEYDADLKANIKTCKLFDLIDFSRGNDFASIDKDASKALMYAEDNVKYYFDSYRYVNGFSWNINELFQREMQWIINRDADKFSDILNKYPIIKYEYVYGDKFERKSLLKLFDDMCLCEVNRDKGIYFNLLRSRLDCNKEDYDLVNKNINSLVKLLESNKYDGNNKKILEYLIKEYYNNKKDKYIKYFYKIGINRR